MSKDPLLDLVVDNKQELIEKFRKALMREHHSDWSMEIISEAAHICARALYPNEATKPLPNDTPDKARRRYLRNGFGKKGAPSSEAALKRYLKLFEPVRKGIGQ